MIAIRDIDKFHRKGRGKVFQFYITDEELMEVLSEINEGGRHTLSIIANAENDDGENTYHEYDIRDFLKARNTGVYLFFIRDKKITPDIDLPEKVVDLSQYYMYNGLIRLWHGFQRKGYQQESNIMLIDSYYRIDNPEEAHTNKEYSYTFGALKRKIKSRLKFKGNHIGKSGKTYLAKERNLSVGFVEKFSQGLIKSTVQVER